MADKKKKIVYRYIALVVAVVVLASSLTILLSAGIVGSYNAGAVNQYEIIDSDRKMAEDISDITGISVYKLLEMRESSASWNDVMEKIQQDDTTDIDISDSELTKLTEGFSKEDIDYANALVSRVVFNLREINAKSDSAAVSVPNPNDLETADNNDDYDFKSLDSSFRKNLAIYLILALKDSFGSMELVLDEYLYCLQVGVDLRLCVTNREEYDKQIAEKSGQLLKSNAITVAIIEEKMLSVFSANVTEEIIGDAAGSSAPQNDGDAEANNMQLPTAPAVEANIPVIENPMPKDPAAEVYNEIIRISIDSMPY